MTGRPKLKGIAAAALGLLLWGCAGPPGGSMIAGPLPEPEPPPPEPETFAGREALKSRIEAAGGFEGMIALFDGPASGHGQAVRQDMIDEGVPPDRIEFPDLVTTVTDITQINLPQNEDLLACARVAHVPFLTPITEDREPDVIAAHNIVWSIAAGSKRHADRNLWHPDHPHWEGYRGSSCCANAYENHMKAFETGKALIATYAHRDGEGGYTAIDLMPSCGEARDACFVVAQPMDENGGTSSASAKLAAAAFYVFQLYEKAEEVVDTLKECAEDIGEPGVDAEFGLGVVSLACARVENAEVLTASSLLVVRWNAPALEGLLYPRPGPGLRVRASRWIAGRDGLPLARLGAEYGVGPLDLSLSAGRGRAPLGVGSRYVHARPAAYAETAAGWRLFGQDGRDLRAVLSLGRGGGSLSPRMWRAGLVWRGSSPGWSWSAYAGRSRAEGRIGIPGHREAGRGRSLARAGGWETLLRLEGRL